MESIKEKSENLYPDKKVVLARGNTCLSCGRVKRMAFVEGANYVLDAIQSCIDRHEDGCLALEAIILTIDELRDKNYEEDFPIDTYSIG